MDSFTYINEENINEYLKCSICHKPYINPVFLHDLCESTFCFNCIASTFKDHSKRCETCCGRNLSVKDLKAESRSLKKLLDDLLVQCDICLQKDIKRSQLLIHMNQVCPQRLVKCVGSDVGCPWRDSFSKLAEHARSCPYKQLRTLLTKLQQDSAQLKELRINFEQLRSKYQGLQNGIQQLENTNRTLIKQLKEIDTLKDENKRIQEQYNQEKTKNEDFQDKINLMENIIVDYEKLRAFLKEANLMQIENEQLKPNMDSLHQVVGNWYLQMKQYEEDLKRSNELLQRTIIDKKVLENQCEDYQMHVDRLSTNNGRLQQDISFCEQRIEHLQKLLNQSEVENHRLDDQCLQYTKKLDELTIDVKRLKAKVYQPLVPKSKTSTSSKATDQTDRLGQLIQKCQSNFLVNLNGEKIDDYSIETVVDIALVKKQCESLILWNNGLTLHSVSRLASTLTAVTTLQKLSISNNILSDESMKKLSEALAYNKSSLRQLVLSSNGITDGGVSYLSTMLKTNNVLNVLGLQDNNLSDKSVGDLCNALKCHNNALQELSLYSNKLISDTSVIILMDMLANNQSLKVLWIWDCAISEDSKSKLQKFIESKDGFKLSV